LPESLDETHPIHGFEDPADYDAARASLTDYTADRFREKLGIEEVTPPGQVEGESISHRLRGHDPIDELFRLFALGRPLDRAAAERALPAPDLDRWVSSGILHRDGDGVRAAFRLLPMPKGFPGWYVGDIPDHLERPDFIMCPGYSSVFLAKSLIPARGGRVLDMGTGNGFLSLVAATDADRVTGVDLCPRAAPMATFNARLNGRPDLDFVTGSLFEPVADREFDLMVFNAPHVLSPGQDRMYRDAGDFDHGIVWRFARELPKHLADGGFAQITAHWPLTEGESSAERLGRWFAGLECDVWVLIEKRWACEEYAREFIGDTSSLRDPDFPAEYARWLAAYEATGVREIGTGLIVVRRRPGAECWLHVEDRPKAHAGLGDDLLRGFLRRDFLNDHRDDPSLLAARPVVCPDLRLRTEAGVGENGWEVLSQEVRRTTGLGYEGTLDPLGVGLLVRCDGKQTVGDLLAEVAQALGRDAESLAGPVLGAVRIMISMGFLEPNSAN
jgi:SAM-dependent methyltransferase